MLWSQHTDNFIYFCKQVHHGNKILYFRNITFFYILMMNSKSPLKKERKKPNIKNDNGKYFSLKARYYCKDNHKRQN